MGVADKKREQAVEKMADFLLAEGLDKASLRPLAAAAGISDRMLIYYFSDKDRAIAASLDVAVLRFEAVLQDANGSSPLAFDGLKAQLGAWVLAGEQWPFFVLWLDVAARAGRGDAVCRRVSARVGRMLLDWISGQLSSRERGAESARLAAILQGLVMLKAAGMDVIADAAL